MFENTTHMGAFQELRRERTHRFSEKLIDCIANIIKSEPKGTDPAELIFAMTSCLGGLIDQAVTAADKEAFHQLCAQYEQAQEMRKVMRQAVGMFNTFHVLAALRAELKDAGGALMTITTIQSAAATEAAMKAQEGEK